ncbi:hypothetical protein Nm8I071_44110 [Nonomuraea sp. TT08I-71]|nr:hypothetical protein Nm8I071_44110 [Nonomuraea sp. TT08I-71]
MPHDGGGQVDVVRGAVLGGEVRDEQVLVEGAGDLGEDHDHALLLNTPPLRLAGMPMHATSAAAAASVRGGIV